MPFATPSAAQPASLMPGLPGMVKVQSAELNLMTSANDSQGTKKRSSAEGKGSLTSNDPVSRNRVTRSHSRRKERAIARAIATTQQDSEVAEDPNDVYQDIGFDASEDDNLEVPHTPSPIKSEQRSSRTVGNAMGQNTSYIPRPPLIDFCRNSTTTADNLQFPEPSSSDAMTTLPADYETPYDDSPTKSIDFDISSAPSDVVVNVPDYNPMVFPDYQWTSCFRSTSRPEHPWGWLRKWKCCQCGALTMVEQHECARISCGHYRCDDGCGLKRGRVYA